MTPLGQYRTDGKKQIAEYFDYYGMKQGYVFTPRFARDKKIGMREVRYGDYALAEAIV